MFSEFIVARSWRRNTNVLPAQSYLRKYVIWTDTSEVFTRGDVLSASIVIMLQKGRTHWRGIVKYHTQLDNTEMFTRGVHAFLSANIVIMLQKISTHWRIIVKQYTELRFLTQMLQPSAVLQRFECCAQVWDVQSWGGFSVVRDGRLRAWRTARRCFFHVSTAIIKLIRKESCKDTFIIIIQSVPLSVTSVMLVSRWKVFWKTISKPSILPKHSSVTSVRNYLRQMEDVILIRKQYTVKKSLASSVVQNSPNLG